MSRKPTERAKERALKKMKDWHKKFLKTRRKGWNLDLRDEKHKGTLRKHRPVPVIPPPEVPNGCSALKCLDAIGCRRNALTKRKRGLPIFSPLDEWEPFSEELLQEADFVFVKIDNYDGMELFPYTGSRWYAAEVCEYMLEKGLINQEDCKAMLRATRHVSGETLQRQLSTIEEVYSHLLFPSEKKRKDFVKGCVLSAIGLWNSTKQFSYKQVQSYYEIDAGRGVKQRKRMEDGSFVFTAFTELVGLYSMAPWGRIALDVEQMRIAQAIEAASQNPEHVEVVGAHVDGVFLTCHSIDPVAICDWLVAQHKFADGEPVFQIKDEPVCKVPTWPQDAEHRSQSIDFKKPVWLKILERDVPDRLQLLELLVAKILERKGLLLSGAAGTGKSFLLRMLMKVLSERVPGKHLATALRHNTTMLICGKTIAHYLHKYISRGGAPRPAWSARGRRSHRPAERRCWKSPRRHPGQQCPQRHCALRRTSTAGSRRRG